VNSTYPSESVCTVADANQRRARREGLFVAPYFAETRKTALFIVTVKQEAVVADDVIAHARAYLELHELEAEFIVSEAGTVAEAVLGVVREHAANLIAVGGYGPKPVVEAVPGSSVDQPLR